MDSNISIAGIKVNSNGLKGIEVLYSRVEVGKDGRDWINEYWTSRSFPINKELDKLVKAFRFYLYDVYEYDMEKVNEAELEIGEIKSSGDSFQIIGKRKVMNGTKYVPLKTCKILEEDGYGKYGEVMGLVGQLYAEVGEYMEGKRDEVNDVQLVLDWNKGKEFDEVEFRGMAVADQRDMATEILEKLGSIVIHRDEVNGEEVGDIGQVDLEESIKEVTSPESKLEITAMSKDGKVIEGNTLAVKPLFCAQPNFDDAIPVEQPAKLVEEDEDGNEESFNITAVKTV